MKIEVSFACCMCLEEHLAEVVLPDGWDCRYDQVDEEHAFCPRHAKVADFAGDQCPGCVGGWQDCGLWSAFAHKNSRTLTENDFAVIRTGVCPKRVNGTFSIGPQGMKTEDISERATTESGVALADAIKEYWIRF